MGRIKAGAKDVFDAVPIRLIVECNTVRSIGGSHVYHVGVVFLVGIWMGI